MRRDASPSEVTRLLDRLGGGDGDARLHDAERLFALVYDELRHMAAGMMRVERADHTLQPTALVNEAYVKLVDQSRSSWESRAHFFGVAARAMRQVLIDHARRHRASKRGGEWQRITLDERLPGSQHDDLEILDLDRALTRLEQLDERMARVVELHVFAGLTMKEVAAALDVSKRTADGDWSVARRWLSRALRGDEE